MKLIQCIFLGYLLGGLNPAAFLSKIKKIDFRSRGTKNFGATNTLLLLGKGYGAFVMVFDIAKAYVSVKLSQVMFPQMIFAGLIGGAAAVIGHVFPFYMRFKGGKGLASFGGMILGVDPVLFLLLLCISVLLMLMVNYSYAMPVSAGILFPVLYYLETRDMLAFVISAMISGLIIWKHFGNIGKAKRGEDVKIREYIKNHLF